MFKFTSHDSILIEVHDGRYDCYGDLTPSNLRAYQALQAMGGVSDTVADGFYHFNADRRGFVTTYTLTPYED